MDFLNKKTKNLRVLPQTGRTRDLIRDLSRRATLPGKRVSRSGMVYWETRMNRTDRKGRKI